jgi:hypothetical protein
LKLIWHETYKKLTGDPIFEEEFQNFITGLLDKSRDNSVITLRVDEEIQKFLEKYLFRLRQEKIDKILGKKDI